MKKKWLEIWNDILESVKGTDKDFTTIPVGKAILLLAVPMVLEMIMESLFAIVDIFFISRLGSEAIATVGVTESLMTLIYAIGMGFGLGTTAIIARRIGQKNFIQAGFAGMHALMLGLLASVIFAVPGILYAPEILRLMGSSESIVQTGVNYTTIMFGSNLIIMLLFINNAILRSAGDAAMAMKTLWLANGINIVLDPFLIFGLGAFPGLGVTGAAIATTTGRSIGVIFQFFILFKGTHRIRLFIKDISIDFRLIRSILKLSMGGIGQSLIATTSWIGLYWILGRFGDKVFAGYTVAIRIVLFSLLPAWGISNAAATLVGQNLGAERSDRAERSVWITSLVNVGYLLLAGSSFVLFPDFFIGLFGVDDQVLKIGTEALKVISYGYIFYGLGMVMTQALNGAGDTYTPTLLNFICFWLIELPLAYVLSMHFNMHEKGVFLSVLIAESILGVLAVLFFRKGKWKLNRV
jgi:putative MATE family efflux protein